MCYHPESVIESVTNSSEDEARKRREREFHDHTFSHDSRSEISRFYTVMGPSAENFEKEIMQRATGKIVLEYGCGPGTHSFRLATVAERVVGIDLSGVAIEKARERARNGGVHNVEFHVMDAEQLTFPGATFDLVCGRAIVHHLNVARCFETVSQVLKPGGAALFQEPLGHNPVINLYRKRTPHLRTVDEHPLLMSDFRKARQYFHKICLRPFILSSLLAVPLHKTILFQPALRALTALDSVLFSVPFMRPLAWTSIWILEEPRRAEGS
jgi:ubiquinone/menaquinone biosynthesis C-methylase UbiE